MTDNQRQPLDPEFLAWARERVREMNKTADEVCEEVGLPADAKPLVVRALFGSRIVDNDESDAD